MIAALRHHLQRLSKDTESGQAMVEFVIVFPMQLLLTLSVLQFAFIAHAHIVVGQAAFQGARAGAVADVGVDVAGKDAVAARQEIAKAITAAGNRSAARVCALLTSESVITPDAGTDLKSKDKDRLIWRKEGAAWYGFSKQREDQAYELLTADTKLVEDTWIVCDLEFEYILQIPVANSLFATFSSKRGTYGADQFKSFNIRRVGFVPTPWRTKGVED